MTRSKVFQALVEGDPLNPMFRFSLGQALWQEGAALAACEHLRFAAEAKPDWMMPRILLGKCYLAGENRQQARAVFTEALQLAIAQGHEDPEAELRALLAGI